MIVRLPDVRRSGTIAAQPELALDASQIEPFRKLVIVGEWHRRDGDRAGWRLVLPLGLSPIAFGLITILQSEVGTKLERAESQTECPCSRIDLGAGGAIRKGEITDGELDGHHRVSRR